MQVRAFRPDDAAALAELFYAAVHAIARPHYSHEQVQAWAPAIPDADGYRVRASDGRTFLVATTDSDEPLAYGDVEADGHIDHLFCRPDAAGTGVTSILYERLEAAWVARGGGLLHVEASEPARRFLLRKGFAVVERREFPIRGVLIHNYRMEKWLPHSS